MAYESVFISYSHHDEQFAKVLKDALEKNDIRCWYAPEAVVGGRKIHEQIATAINMYDRLLLVLSSHSMRSSWVKSEIASARKLETTLRRKVLFPIRLVPIEEIRSWSLFDADIGSDTAKEIREYFIPDFSNWQDDGAFETEFLRLLLALWRQSPDRLAGETFLMHGLPEIVRDWEKREVDSYVYAIDIDKCQQINKVFGVRVGNEVLGQVAQLIQATGVSYSGRFGDDTFFAVSTIGAGRDHKSKARRMGAMILKRITDHPWSKVSAKLLVSCSVGVARLNGQQVERAVTLAAMAYHAAKARGGKCVEYAGPGYMVPNVPRPTAQTDQASPEPTWRRFVS